jgi:hypothetical protein
MYTRSPERARWKSRAFAAVGAIALGVSMISATSMAANADTVDVDPRVGLSAGVFDAGQAAKNIELMSTTPKSEAFNNYNSDLAFTGNYAISGNYNGFQVYDISNSAAPELKGTFVCPGGQGDVSVYGDLLFMSVESAPGRLDCGSTPSPAASDPQNFRGVRIFDISNILAPVQVTGVQTCRGSHTHTVVEDADDPDNVYIYVSGTAGVRTTTANVPGGCTDRSGNTVASQLDENGNPVLGSRFLVEVIKVPLANPAAAEVINKARLFTDAATGSPAGLWPGGSHGEGLQSTSATDACHDITAYPEIGLAAGACEGNGVLIDISNPADPKRIDAVTDPRFAYWHSATFSNDGTKVVFTDEWGGGSGARCRATDPLNWGANAIFDIVDGKLQFKSYYKMPAPQTAQENCVAHNGSLVPVPGRDIMVQAWYQGGLSVFDFTDSANPKEIAFFDRGPMSPTALVLSGYWSTYWYNGAIFGNEIGRGFDSLALQPSEFLTANEIAAAEEVMADYTNVQGQAHFEHEPSFALAKALVDQAERAGTLTGDALAETRLQIALAEELSADPLNEPATLAALAKAAEAAGEGTAAANALIALAGKLSGGSIPVEATVPQAADGSLALTVADFGDGVSLSQAENAGDRFVFEGELPDLTVTDSRNARQAGDGGWAVAGRSTDLTSIGGSVEASNLGWSPVVKTPRAGLAAGPESVVKLDGGTGLSMTSRLADATADGRMGSATLGAGLFLHLPVNTDPGTYSGALTVSLFPVD